ncbi:MAG TPA: beta-N-acetylhexosaminidase [Candidatus Limnocylindrales bacterium]|nr:beta-N-acetylhexosaminidase [Candidatus Limnocylindrales bacterium]
MKLRSSVTIIAGVVGVLLTLAVARLASLSHQVPALVPIPRSVERQHGTFVLRPQSRILADDQLMSTAQYLAARLRVSTGFELPISTQAESPAQGDIILKTQGVDRVAPEGYILNSSPQSVVIRGSQPEGVFYGAQSLLQLFSPAVFASKRAQKASWSIPCIKIEDAPRFSYRGFMLDVSRHFFSKEEIKRLLDLMALHKLNTFHWHLTDDQGWRVEIKEYPKLVEVGAWRKSIGFGLDPKASNAYGPDGRYGGFYSQSDIREIVTYAQVRHITVIPEIEMPGHSSAALLAYPEFGCPRTAPAQIRRAPDVYCAGKEETFTFLENVLIEICDLFPGKYIHIGGDEVSKRNWRECSLCQARIAGGQLKNEAGLQNYFERRIVKFLESKGRTAIGWSEIREGGLPPDVAIMDWLGEAADATHQGHDVVSCPNTYCYFDYYQSQDRSAEPPASGAYLPLERVYSFEPIPLGLDRVAQAHILGPQANLWTEYIPSIKQAEYMAFPRLCALAEVAWLPPDRLNWRDFSHRLEAHLKRLAELGVNYRKPQL